MNNDQTEAFWFGSLTGSSPMCPKYGRERSETVAINYEKKIAGVASC